MRESAPAAAQQHTRAAREPRPSALGLPTLAPNASNSLNSCPCGGSCPRCDASTRDAAGHSGRERHTTSTVSPDAGASALGTAQEREQAADARATELLQNKTHASSPGALIASRSVDIDVPSLPGPFRALAAEGRPIDATPLAPIASRSGADTSRLRVHDGENAARACRIVNAKAFTFGRHIVFGRGEYRPGTSAGDALAAHEIAHAEQQASSGIHSIDRQAVTPLPPASYQPLLDQIASAQRTDPSGHQLQVLRALETLAIAVESGNQQGVTAGTSAFLAAVKAGSLSYSTASGLEYVPLTLVSRIFMLGLRKESAILEGHFFGKDGKSDYREISWHRGYGTDYVVSEQIVNDAIAGVTTFDIAHAEGNIDRLLLALERVTSSLGALDYPEVARLEKRSRDDVTVSMERMEQLGRNPDSDVAGHFGHLLSLLPRIVSLIQRSFQTLMDAAQSDLESGKGDAMLNRASAILEGKLIAPFRTASGIKLPPHLNRMLNASVEVTRSDFAGKHKKHLDYFDRSASSPSVEIQAYDKDETNFSEKELSLLRVLEIRGDQIRFLQQLFGLAKTKTGGITPESAENAAAVKASGAFKLHDNDSWRAFLLEKFNARKQRLGQDWPALRATVDILQAYLKTYTFHTPYNIDEFGDNYLSHTFPRALTGQLIHDCGVYALRVAYALSLVRDKLGLQFRAVILPVHVALVISFEDVTKGVLIVNNDQILALDPGSQANAGPQSSSPAASDPQSKIQTFIDRWQRLGSDDTSKPPVRKLDTDKFLASLSSATFIDRTDIPFRVAKVPNVPNVPSAKARKKVLWDFYHNQIVKHNGKFDPVLAPTPADPQPELRYLHLLETQKRLINELGVPFWRYANAQLSSKHDALFHAAADLSSSDAGRKEAAKKVLDAHRSELVANSKLLLEAVAQLNREREEVSGFLKDHPGAVAKSATVSKWQEMRVSLNWNDFIDELATYVGDDTTPGALRDGRVLPVSWEKQEELPKPVD